MQFPSCNDSLTNIFDIQEINDLLISNENSKDILSGIKSQIDTMINNKASSETNQLKNINILLANVLTIIDENIYKLKNINDKLDENYEKKKSLSNIERHHIKGSKGWENYLAEKLFNTQFENGDIYNNILTKALMIGNNGAFWAYSSNINISPFQFDKIQKLFNQNSITDKEIELEDKIYTIINYKPKISLDLKEGENGATIAKTNLVYIFGFFNFNNNYKLNGEPNKQNLQLCNKVVEELADEIKKLNY